MGVSDELQTIRENIWRLPCISRQQQTPYANFDYFFWLLSLLPKPKCLCHFPEMQAEQTGKAKKLYFILLALRKYGTGYATFYQVKHKSAAYAGFHWEMGRLHFLALTQLSLIFFVVPACLKLANNLFCINLPALNDGGSTPHL